MENSKKQTKNNMSTNKRRKQIADDTDLVDFLYSDDEGDGIDLVVNNYVDKVEQYEVEPCLEEVTSELTEFDADTSCSSPPSCDI